MTLTEARKLAAQIVSIFAADKIAGARVAVHLDPDAADASLADGLHVVLIGPPDVEYHTWNQVKATWTLTIIAVPAADRLAAWHALDALTDALRADLDIDRVRPAEWIRPAGGVYGAYIATATHEYDLQ